jgi:hypothetical protein
MAKYRPSSWRVETACRLGEPVNANGFQIMHGDDTVVEMYEGNGWTKARLKTHANLMAAAPQMKQDIDNFIAAMDECKDRSEAGDIARDFYRLFRQSQALAEGKKL